MAFETPRVIEASSAKTANGNSGQEGIAGKPGREVGLLVDVTAVAGVTPTLDLKVQWSYDDGTTWADADPADAFAQISAVKQVIKEFNIKAPLYRVVWTVGGTSPSFTFSIREYVT